MKKNKYVFLTILVTNIIIFNENTFAQDEIIRLCNIRMRIGMDWEEIIPVIAAKYFHYTNLKDSEIYTIWDTTDKQMVLGVIAFDSDNRLNYVSKKWFNSRSEKCIDAWEILYVLLSKYQINNQISANTSGLLISKSNSKYIEFFLGRRNITVNIQDGMIVDIDESLR